MRVPHEIKLALYLLLSIAGITAGANNARSSTAEQCGVDKGQPAQRIFATLEDEHGWREYKTVKDVPELPLSSSQLAQIWTGHDHSVLVAMEEPGEDFTAFTDYCFDAKGILVHLRFALRTAWGWGYREEGSIVNGKLTAKKSEFFSTKTDQPIPKPEMADDIPEALKPTLFLGKSKLPFAKLLTK